MAHPMGEVKLEPLRVDFDRRLIDGSRRGGRRQGGLRGLGRQPRRRGHDHHPSGRRAVTRQCPEPTVLLARISQIDHNLTYRGCRF